jgi:hypothetical protein
MEAVTKASFLPAPEGYPLRVSMHYHIHCQEQVRLTLTGCLPFLNRYPELMLDRWAKRFGQIYSMWLGSQLFVVVSDPAIAKDLLVTNGRTFSSRKEMFIKSQTVFAGRGITATPYNEKWFGIKVPREACG